MCTVVCSQSSFFRKIIEIERFPLRAAILHECEDNLGSGGGLRGSEKNKETPLAMKNMPHTFSIDIACLQISPFKAVLYSFWAIPPKI